MEPEELRIGNLVKCKISNDAGIYQVLSLPGWENNSPEFMVTIDRCPKQSVPISKIKPIPLNPETLEACGFKKSENKNKNVWYVSFVREHDELNSYIFVGKAPEDPIKMYYFGFESPMTAVNINNIYSLHQLQNLFFVLTGKELQWNPKPETAS